MIFFRYFNSLGIHKTKIILHAYYTVFFGMSKKKSAIRRTIKEHIYNYKNPFIYIHNTHTCIYVKEMFHKEQHRVYRTMYTEYAAVIYLSTYILDTSVQNCCFIREYIFMYICTFDTCYIFEPIYWFNQDIHLLNCVAKIKILNFKKPV